MIMLMKSLPLLFLLTVGCTGTIRTPTTISHTFSPDPVVENVTRKALSRWVAATGIGLSVSSAGTSVSVNNDWVISDEGNLECGITRFSKNEIELSTKTERCSYWSFESLALHEIGHMITWSNGHSETGIMAPGGPAINRECIDEDSLNLICDGNDCSMFEPEC